jgi:hypothetical protein
MSSNSSDKITYRLNRVKKQQISHMSNTSLDKITHKLNEMKRGQHHVEQLAHWVCHIQTCNITG